jgi:hypothetical protein
MTLADGKVAAIERVGSFLVPAESSTWLAYYKGVGGAGGGGGRAGAGGRGGRGGAGATPPAAGGRAAAAQATQAQAKPGEKRKDAGSDLILRNLATGEDTTIPEVTEYLFDTKGAWLAYATSSTEPAKDGAFARRLSDATVRTLMTGRGHYKSLAFDEAGQQIAFLSDQAEYDKPVSPYRLYLWKGTVPVAPVAASAPAKPAAARAKPAAAAAAPAVAPAAQAASAAASGEAMELVSGSTSGVPKGMVVADSVAPRFSRDATMVFLGTAPASAPPPDPDAKTPTPIAVDLGRQGRVDSTDAEGAADQERGRSYRAVVHLADRRFVQLATPDLPR